jgi:hypothetical protein
VANTACKENNSILQVDGAWEIKQETTNTYKYKHDTAAHVRTHGSRARRSATARLVVCVCVVLGGSERAVQLCIQAVDLLHVRADNGSPDVG